MYAPYGAGVLIGPRQVFSEGDPFLVGGGAVDVVGLDEVVWTAPPYREEAGSPNVVGAVALSAAINYLGTIGWEAITSHDKQLATALRRGLAAIPGVRVLGPGLRPRRCQWPHLWLTACHMPWWRPGSPPRTPSASGMAVFVPTLTSCGCSASAGKSSKGTGPRSGGEPGRHPGAVRASLGINATVADVERLCAAVARLTSGGPPGPLHPGPPDGRLQPCRPNAAIVSCHKAASLVVLARLKSGPIGPFGRVQQSHLDEIL